MNFHIRKVCVQNDVIPQQLVAVVSMDVVLSKQLLGLRLDAKQTFDDNVVNLHPHERDVKP